MKRTTALLFLATALWGAGQEQTFTGTITDSMCGANHQKMKIAPDPKCVRDCVGSSQGAVKFALNDGRNTYKLSDQATPAQFSGQRVKVTGILFPKTSVIQVSRIEAVR
jgi:hypothetical protein